MESLDSFYDLLGNIDESWAQREAVDWSEAEQIARYLKELPDHMRNDLPCANKILSYAQATEEWDCEFVGTWPLRLRRDMEDSDKQFGYRPKGDNWEVYSLILSGAEEWKATVETELLAVILINALDTKNPIEPKADCH